MEVCIKFKSNPCSVSPDNDYICLDSPARSPEDRTVFRLCAILLRSQKTSTPSAAMRMITAMTIAAFIPRLSERFPTPPVGGDGPGNAKDEDGDREVETLEEEAIEGFDCVVPGAEVEDDGCCELLVVDVDEIEVLSGADDDGDVDGVEVAVSEGEIVGGGSGVGVPVCDRLIDVLGSRDKDVGVGVTIV